MIDYEMIAAREAISQTAAALAEVQANHVAIYLTMLFAYLTVAYLAGKKLTRVQLAIVTFIFIAASAREVSIIAGVGALIRAKMVHFSEVYSGAVTAPAVVAIAGGSLWLTIILWSTGIVAALVFMGSVRRSKTE